jgi:hypothetical protein
MIVNRKYQLIRLRCSTVDALKKLREDAGVSGIDALVVEMIRLTCRYRHDLQGMGWSPGPEERSPFRPKA